jgi:hypothetical protein
LHVVLLTHYLKQCSEGPGLTQSDAKAYWGKIEERNLDRNDGDEMVLEDDVSNSEDQKRIEVKGTIFSGWGLEPGKLLSYS